MAVIHEPHDCFEDFKRRYPGVGPWPGGSVWECDECGTRLIKGKWFGGWRNVRFFDRYPKADRCR